MSLFFPKGKLRWHARLPVKRPPLWPVLDSKVVRPRKQEKKSYQGMGLRPSAKQPRSSTARHSFVDSPPQHLPRPSLHATDKKQWTPLDSTVQLPLAKPNVAGTHAPKKIIQTRFFLEVLLKIGTTLNTPSREPTWDSLANFS